MVFGRPDYFRLFWALPCLALFYLFRFYRGQKLLSRFADRELLPQLLSAVSFFRKRLKAALMVVSLGCLILTVSEPKWGFSIEEVKRHGVDLVIALDISKSMLAQDVKPSRLSRAKLEIANLLKTLKGDRVGLVIFAGDAFLQCPLTLDYAAVQLFLEDVSVTSISRGGSDIGGALREAVKAFQANEGGDRAVILITDGEDLGGRVDEALEAVQKEKIIVYPVGIGRPEGVPIPFEGEEREKRYVRDRQGEVVVSKLHPALLQKVASATGGRGGTIGTGFFSLEELYRHDIAKLEKRELGSEQKKEYHHRFQWPLAAAIFLLYLEGLLRERK